MSAAASIRYELRQAEAVLPSVVAALTRAGELALEPERSALRQAAAEADALARRVRNIDRLASTRG